MLTHLYIRNFALIDQLDISFNAGFSVVTGETGAGKSIILGALALLAGTRADTKAIKEGADKCVVEAHFAIDDNTFQTFLALNDIDTMSSECILRREINSSGKSRAFANDTPVSLALLKEISEQLVDIHSQHQNLLLKNNTFQLSVVDTIAGSQQLLAAYIESYQAYIETKKMLSSTRDELEANQRNIDFIRFQYEELERMGLQEGEEEQLEQQTQTMQHAEDIKRALYEADNHLGDEQTGILARLHRSTTALNNIIAVYNKGEDIARRISDAYIELKDVSAEIASRLDETDYDPNEMERLTSRLDAIYTLEKKHGVSNVTALIELREKYKGEIERSDNSDMVLRELERQLDERHERCLAEAHKLSNTRKKSIAKIEHEMAERLKKLGLTSVQFKVSISEKEPSADGTDKVEFLFSANLGVPLRAISEVASGGEIARVMLALKAMMSNAAKLPTIIFDEIDTGVSGKIAEQMAITMKEMSCHERQVISITHLPQIASCGTTHYKVYKQHDNNETVTRIKMLTDEERIEEIAQMLSGNNVSEAAVRNARELLGSQEDILILT